MEAQILFFQGEQPDVSYADRNGKYMKQIGVTLPKVEFGSTDIIFSNPNDERTENYVTGRFG